MGVVLEIGVRAARAFGAVSYTSLYAFLVWRCAIVGGTVEKLGKSWVRVCHEPTGRVKLEGALCFNGLSALFVIPPESEIPDDDSLRVFVGHTVRPLATIMTQCMAESYCASPPPTKPARAPPQCRQPRVSDMLKRTRKDMWHSEEAAVVVHALKFSLNPW